MRLRDKALGVLGAVASTGACVALNAPAAHAQPEPPIVRQPFSVDADQCRSGYALGFLVWRTAGTQPTVPIVQIDGVVVDEVRSECATAGRRVTEVTFYAYAGNTVVDMTGTGADDGAERILLRLTSPTAFDRVEVQVCRRSIPGPNAPGGPPVCGMEAYHKPS